MGLKSIPRGSKSKAPETVAPGPAAGQTPDTSALTVRERDVMALLSRGRTNKDISATLGISACTVAVHVKRIYRKLKVRSRKELATAIAPLHYRRASRHTNAESYVMALDQGTTSSRAIIFDRHGGVKAIAQKEFEPQMPGARVTELRKGWRRALRAAEAWAE